MKQNNITVFIYFLIFHQYGWNWRTEKKKTPSIFCQLKMLCWASTGTPWGTERAPNLIRREGKKEPQLCVNALRKLKLQTGNGSNVLQPLMLKLSVCSEYWNYVTGLLSESALSWCTDPPHSRNVFRVLSFFFFFFIFWRKKRVWMFEGVKQADSANQDFPMWSFFFFFHINVFLFGPSGNNN